MSLHAIPGKKADEPEDEPRCQWCHPLYPCHEAKPKFNRMNCPRVEGLRFLSGEECHYDKDGNMVWDIQAVSFRLPDEIEIEFPSDEDATGDA